MPETNPAPILTALDLTALDLASTNVTSRHCFIINGSVVRDHVNDSALPLSLNCGTLSAQHRQDLANALPFLACGEESAIHAFSSSLLKHLNDQQRAEMAQIANDELRHAHWLECLRIALPQPNLHLSSIELTRFFKRLLTRNTSLHFARVAALDSAVCKLLAPLLHAESALVCQSPQIHAGLVSIALDEARHVKAARAMAAHFGLSQLMQVEVNAAIKAELWQLLTPVLPGLARLARRTTANL